MRDRDGDAPSCDVLRPGVLEAIGLSDAALSIGGSVIVMLIAIRMVFPQAEGVFGEIPGGEPYIVPLAVPAIAGPSTLATIMMLAASGPERMWEWAAIVAITCVVSFFVLASAEWMQRRLGEKVTLAIERLTGPHPRDDGDADVPLGARILHFPLHAGGGLSSAQGRPGRRKRPGARRESKKQGVSVDTPLLLWVKSAP